MRICIIANGDSVHTRRWVEPLVERGHEIAVLSYTPVRQPITGTETVDLTSLNNTPKFRFLLWARWIRRFLRAFAPDIVNAHQIQAAGWLGVSSGFHPLVITAWGSDLLIDPHRSSFRRKLTAAVLRGCDRLTVPSEVMLRAARELSCPAERAVIISWGIETHIFRPNAEDRYRSRAEYGLSAETPVVLCPRSIRPVHNQDVLLAALSEITAAAPAVRLLLLRYNPKQDYLDFLEEKIAALGLRENVIWLKPQNSFEGMARLYRLADVVVSIPSSEGYGLTVYEALATGAATIISDLPAFEPDLVDQSHTLKVGIRNPEQTREALTRLIFDPVFRKKLAANAAEIGAKHNASTRVTETESLYKECIAQSAASRLPR
jgi:glycosyltransferase involved in cell wall biosynthesis